MTERPKRVVIVGGGIGGLTVALTLARRGRPVTLLERDALPPGDDVEAAFLHPRSGTPQARHTHGLLARMTQVLGEHLPDVLDDLRAHGAREVPLDREHPVAGEPSIVLVRRTTLELVLREAVRREPGIDLRDDESVIGLTALEGADGPIRQVDGVTLADGTTLAADAVVVSTGRRGPMRSWLSDLGVTIPEVEHETNLVYLTRWYRTSGEHELALDPKLAGDLDFIKYLAVPGDAHTFSITLACPVRDGELRSALLDPDTFDRAARRIPGPAAAWTKHDLVAISGVEPMGGLINRLRTFIGPDGQPLVTGLHAIGDAHTCTNPLYGRGCSLAMVQATLLAEAFAAHPDDATARAIDYERGSAREVEPWFHHSVTMDSTFGRQKAPERYEHGQETKPKPERDRRANGLDALMAAAATDPVLGHGMMQVLNLLKRPEQLATDPAFMERAMKVFADPAAVPRPERVGPTRDELLSALTH